MKRYQIILFAVLGLLLQAQKPDTPQTKNPDKPVVYRFEIRDEIGPPTWRKTKLAMQEAHEMGADVIVLVLNTYGGRVDAADSIRTKLLNAKIPVIVFIENNAASAGALISLACDSIYMKPGSTIGAATVVNQKGEQVPDKYQSYMRKKMRATAEENNRNPDIAEAMVDPDKVVEGISEKGKVLTFTANEALEHGFCDGIFSSPDEALAQAGYEDYTETKYTPTGIDKVIGWLIDPVISGLLIMLIIGGIYFEMQTPGIGFPIAIAVMAAIVYFAPLYLQGLAENWEIIVFIAGIVLLGIEIFAIPGFGFFGIAGIVMMVFGLALSLIGNIGFDFTGIEVSRILKAVFLVLIAASLSVGGSIALGAKLLTSHAFSRLVLNSVQAKTEGYVSSGRSGESDLVGKKAIALTVLRPSGKIEINNSVYDATASEGFVDKGEEVKIERYQSAQFFVRKLN